VNARAAAGEHPPRPPIPIVPVDERARGAVRERVGDLARLGELAVWLAGVTGSERPAIRARLVLATGGRGGAARDRGGVGAGTRDSGGLRSAARDSGGRGATARDSGGVGAGGRDSGGRGGAARDGDGRGGAAPDGAPALDGAARELHADVVRVDPGLPPSRDPAAGPALEVAEVAAAVDTGRELAARAARDGITVLAGAAPSPGAAVAATSLAAALTGRPPAGPHAAPAARSLARHAGAVRGPLGALRRLGDADVALLCGLALGAGEQGLGYLCDGLTGTAAAAVAVAVEPGLLPRLLAGPRAAQPAHGDLLDHMGLEPAVDLALGGDDGTGALAVVAMLRVAAALACG
jgi:nicotinate-nucleotide--dimethylbenzimidazole phosphoribosyltransferase